MWWCAARYLLALPRNKKDEKMRIRPIRPSKRISGRPSFALPPLSLSSLLSLLSARREWHQKYVKWLHRHWLRLEMPLSPVSRICLWSCALLQIVQVNTLAAVDSSSSDSQKRKSDGLWLSLMLISEHWQDQLSWLGRTSRDQLHFDNRRIVHDSRLSTASLSRCFISKAKMCLNKNDHHPIKHRKNCECCPGHSLTVSQPSKSLSLWSL